MRLVVKGLKTEPKQIVIVREKRSGCGHCVALEPVRAGVKRARFDAFMHLQEAGQKQFSEVKVDNTVMDYRDVKIKGYLSTFEAVTRSDRDGEYVVEGAFAETIQRFMKNPVMLMNHQRNVESIVGKFTKVKEDKRGLYVEGELSNAPELRAIRFKVVEGSINTMSMGGIFHYLEDGRGIFKVDLWEGSLVSIPANPDALITTRALTEDEEHQL